METKILFKRGNLFTGSVYGVLVEDYFGSSELHGPFNSELAASNYGFTIANETYGHGIESISLVTIEAPIAKKLYDSKNDCVGCAAGDDGPETHNLAAYGCMYGTKAVCA